MTAVRHSVTAALLAMTANRHSVIAVLLAMTAVRHSVTAALLAVTAGQHSVTAALLAMTAGQHSVTAALLAVTAGRHSVTAALLAMTAGRHSVTAKRLAVTAGRRGKCQKGKSPDLRGSRNTALPAAGAGGVRLTPAAAQETRPHEVVEQGHEGRDDRGDVGQGRGVQHPVHALALLLHHDPLLHRQALGPR